MNAGLWLLAGAAAIVLLVFLEGRRQERIYGRSGRASLMRTGLLEIQRHLEPERRVEMLIEERDETEQDAAGDGAAGHDADDAADAAGEAPPEKP